MWIFHDFPLEEKTDVETFICLSLCIRMHITLIHTLFLAVPGAPQNVRAAEVSPPIENVCIILVTWDPPANSDRSDIDRYIVYVPSRNIADIESSAISVLRILNCRDDIRIQVAAVNLFGCVGLNSSEVQPSLSFDTAQTTEGTQTTEGAQTTERAQTTQDARGSTTSTPIGSTSASSKY